MPVTPADLARTLVRRAAARRGGDRTERDACLQTVTQAIPALRRELGFGRVWLIGSLVWGNFGIRSDLDVVIEGASADAATTLADKLSEATARAVDVLVLETLPEPFRARILAEGQHVP